MSLYIGERKFTIKSACSIFQFMNKDLSSVYKPMGNFNHAVKKKLHLSSQNIKKDL